MTLSKHNISPLSLESLITTGLNYCCMHHFFHRFDKVSTTLIAARLGVTTRAVRYKRKAYRDGKLSPCLQEAPKALSQRALSTRGSSR